MPTQLQTISNEVEKARSMNAKKRMLAAQRGNKRTQKGQNVHFVKDELGVITGLQIGTSFWGGGEIPEGSGENNTASNAGTGISLPYQKVGIDLQFNGIKSENAILGVALDAVSHDIELTVDETQIDHDQLLNFSADEHFTQAAISITASQISDFDTEVSNNTDVSANTAARHSAVTVTDSLSVDLTLTGQDITADVLPGGVDHDQLLNFAANEHIDWTIDQGATDIHINNLPTAALIFEEVANVIREKSTAYDNDFVVGSPQLADDGTIGHDNRMFFDKSKGAFRAGEVQSTQWDDVNVGDNSFSSGLNNTASGAHSHAEGQANTASGFDSHTEGQGNISSGDVSHAEGDSNTASGSRTHAGGHNSVAYLNSSFSRASGHFAVNGDAQYTDIVSRTQTTNSTPTELFIEYGTGDSQRLLLPANRTWSFVVRVAARQTGGIAGTIGDSAAYEYRGVIKRDGANNTTLTGSVIETVIAEDQAAWDVDVTADDTNESLKIEVTGEADKTIHWVAKVSLVEVG